MWKDENANASKDLLVHLRHKHHRRVSPQGSLKQFQRYALSSAFVKRYVVVLSVCVQNLHGDIKQLHSRNIFLMRHQHTVCAHFSSTCHCYAYCVFFFFFPFPHAVPKRALQRDKYGSQTKHCLSNVIDFGFTFFSLNTDKGVMRKKKKNVIPFGSNSILL